MKRWLPLMAIFLLGAAPSRDNTYIHGTIIQPNKVRDNEDNIYTYLQNGVSVIADGAVATADLADNAVTTGKILDGTITTADLAFSITQGNILPSGAVFFMLTGSCPSWTTDISATYTGRFIKANATQGLSAGATTHTHTAGSFIGPVHTHTAPRDGYGGDATAFSAGRIVTSDPEGANQLASTDSTTGSGGGGTITGTSASADHEPPSISMKLCKVL